MFLFGILAMLVVGAGWCIFGYLMGEAPKRKFDVTGFLMICTLIEFFASLLIALLQGIPAATAAGWMIAGGSLVACGIVNYFQLDFMSRAMQNGPNGIIWTVAQSGFVFPFAMGTVLFCVPLSWCRSAGFVLILAGLVIFGVSGDNRVSGKWKGWALAAFFATGVSQCLSNLPSYYAQAEAITPMWRTAAFSLGLFLGCLLIRFRNIPELFRHSGELLKRGDARVMALIGGGSNLLFSFLFLYPGMNALAKANAGAIAYPLMVCSCLIVFELYSIIFLREKRSIWQISALLCCLAGTVGICFK